MYARAKEAQADFMADEILDISDNCADEPLIVDGEQLVINGKLIRVVTSASVNHARLRVDARKWVAAKLRPRKYGDKLELSNDPERPLQGMTMEELILRQRELESRLNDSDI